MNILSQNETFFVTKVKINSIQLKSSKTVGDDSEYIYTVKLKGGLVIGNSNITLKSGALKSRLKKLLSFTFSYIKWGSTSSSLMSEAD